jgi:anti-anti-sigma factor
MRSSLFKTVFQDNTLQIQLPPRLTVIEAKDFQQCFQAALAENNTLTDIILDFDQTQVMDSSGVGAFLHNLKCAQAKSIRLISRQISPEVMIVFSLMGLDQVLTLEPRTNG